MSNIPSELKYVSSHEWLRLEADGTVTVGITEHAQELLGDIVFVELPEVGANLAADEQAGVVESVKAAWHLRVRLITMPYWPTTMPVKLFRLRCLRIFSATSATRPC